MTLYALKFVGADTFGYAFGYDDESASKDMLQQLKKNIRENPKHYAQPNVLALLCKTIAIRVCDIDSEGIATPSYKELTQLDEEHWKNYVQECLDAEEYEEQREKESEEIKNGIQINVDKDSKN